MQWGEAIDSVERLSRHLRECVVFEVNQMRTRNIQSASLHLERLRSVDALDCLASNRTCLCCLRRTPENVMSCGHAFCDFCIRIFGTPVLGGSGYKFTLETCVLCGQGRIARALKPPTAGPRILSIDGGGVRGVVPLEFLDMLQSTLGPECPIQDLFDLAFGTSSGKVSHGLSVPWVRLTISQEA